jgi:hypothetical protein
LTLPLTNSVFRSRNFYEKLQASVNKKLDAETYNSDMYVQIIRYLSLINKLRYSSKCRRAITYKQLKSITPKVILPLQLKYRDYFLVLTQVKNLNLKQKYTNMVYEEWACTMLRFSEKDDNELQNDILDKLAQLESDIRLNSLTGSTSSIDYTKIAKVAQEVGK